MKRLLLSLLFFALIPSLSWGAAKDCHALQLKYFLHTSNIETACNNSQSGIASATTATISNDIGGMTASFEYLISGTPDPTSSVSISGCKAGTTCEVIDTYTGNSNVIRAPVVSKLYDYFTVTPTFVNGSSPTLTVNTTLSQVPTPTPTHISLPSSSKSAVTTATNVKASATTLYGFSVSSGATTGCWLELINNSGNGTLGTGVVMNIALPNAGVVNVLPGVFGLADFSSGLAVGVASAIGGSSACGTASSITLWYK